MKKKNELNLWASRCLDVPHLQFEFQQVFDHTIPCCKEIYVLKLINNSLRKYKGN